MLRTEFKQNLHKRVKDAFFNTQMQLMSNRLQPPFIINVFIQLVSFWLNISIFFISDPLQPQIVNEIFNFPLIPSISKHTGIDMDIFKFFLLIEGVVFIVLAIIHLRSTLVNSVLSKVMNVLVFENVFLLVLKTHLMITVLQSISPDSSLQQDAINILFAIIIIIEIPFACAFVYFKVKPFRKKSIYWSFDNMKEFITYIMNFIRVIIIMLDGRSVSFLIVSFLIEFIIWKYLLRFYTKENTKIQTFGVHMSLSGHISLLVYDFTSSPQLGTQILIFLLLVTFINAILSCYSILNEERYFPLCNAEIYEFYDFYFNFVENKIKGSNRSKLVKKDNQSDKMLTIHLLNCHQKNCMVRNVKFSEQTFCEDLQNLCNQVMKTRFYQNKQTEMIYELWKFETGNKFKFRMQSKQLDILHEFIIYCALNLGRLNQKSDEVNQENIKSLKGVFYDKLQGTLEGFSLFYEQITKTQPKMDTILAIGSDIMKRTSDLKCLYSDLLKHSVINFKTAQVYVQFESFFLKQSNVTEQSIDRLRKIQKSKQSQHIEQVYLPTLTAYSETGLIENMNTECLSFFRQTRFELKSKNINSLLYPQIQSMREIKQKLKLNKNQKLYTFFRRRDQIVFGSIWVKEKYIDGKKFDLITIEKNPYSDYRNVFLLNKGTHEIEVVEKEQTFIRPSVSVTTHVVLEWRGLYQNYLKQKIPSLIEERVIKTRIQQVENSLFVMNIEDTFQDDYLIVNTKVIKDMDKKRNRVSSFMLNKPQPNHLKDDKFFHFYYDLKTPYEATLFGVNQNRYQFMSSLKRTTSLGKLERDLSNLVVASTLLRENRFSQGIKTYRLYEGELYNIDLQDKQKYIQQFQDHVATNKDHSMLQASQSDLYMITGIFLTLLILIALTVVYNIMASNTHSTVLWDYTNGLRIEQLRLQMNRMCSIIRDYQLGIYNTTGKDFIPDLTTAYNTLKSLRYQYLLFDSQQIEVSYRNINYTGTLNQIIDVLVSHVYEMTVGSINASQIGYFQDSYISAVNPLIIYQKELLILDIQSSSNDFQKLQDIALIIGIICILAFYVLLGTLVAILNNSAKSKLKNLMMMSDNQARTNQAMADKLRYAVDMLKKNFDFDLKAIIGQVQTHRQRKKPKQVILGIQKKVVIFLALAAGFAVHLILFYNFVSGMPVFLAQLKNYADQGDSLIQTYSMFTQQTNKITHFNTYDATVMEILRQNVIQLADNSLDYNFDNETNTLIDLIFFQNSCQTLWDMGIFEGMNVVCGRFLPNYFVSNPLQLGFVAYFSRVHYYILDNITETYGVTGVYSGPFVTLFSNLVDKLSHFGVTFIQDSFQQLLVYNILFITATVVYIIVTIIVICILKRMNRQINQLLSFLNYSTNLATKHKKSKQKEKIKTKTTIDEKDTWKESSRKKDSSISSITEEEKLPESEFSMPDEEHAFHHK